MARTVLLADDSVTAQNMGRRILMDAGYEVVTVNNGSAALKKVHESQPDLIVLDVYMPGYGGLEVCQRLKESALTMKIPVLLTVGKMEPFKADEAKRVRADGHIVKPFEASELLAALTRLEDKIVPQAENRQGRRAKPETKQRPWGTGDPAVAFDDTHTDQIAHLAEVKKRSSVAAREEIPADPSAASLDSIASGERVPTSGEAVAPATSAELSAPAKMQAPGLEMPVEPAQELEAEAVTFASASAFDGELAAAEGAAEEPAPELAVDSGSVAVVQEEISAGQLVPFVAVPELRSEPAPRWVAESVALTSEEASQSLDDEMRQAQIAAEISVVASGKSPSQLGVNIAEELSEHGREPMEPAPTTPEIHSESGAAFAAAASGSFEAAGGMNSISVDPSDSDRLVPSQAAVAWENWQRIRDSVIGAQTAVESARSVAEIASANTPHETAPSASTESQPLIESDSAFKNAVLASIVDSVLAELKPKLMEEIAKKLAAEKNKAE